MSTATIEPEVLPAESKELLAVVEQHQLQPDTAKSLTETFAPLFVEARHVIEKSRAIVVTDASQKLEIKLARECRLALRSIRVNGDKTRKSLKEESLRKGKAIDGFYNILLHLTEQEEIRLEEQEKFVERQEAQRKAQVKADREKALQPYGIDTTFYQLGEMSDEAWAQLLENTRAAHTAKLEAQRKAEEERIRVENERLKEEQRIREENERLRREAEERERAAKAERERLEREKAAAEEQARKEREAAQAAAAAAESERQRLEAEKLAAEEKARREKEAAEAETARQLEEQKRLADEAARAAEEKARLEREAIEAKARAEREAAEQAAAAERARTEEIARKEREARERVEAELRAQREAAERAKQVAEETARKAALAPEREKLQRVAAQLRMFELPDLTSDGGKIVVEDLTARLEKLAVWLEKEAQTL